MSVERRQVNREEYGVRTNEVTACLLTSDGLEIVKTGAVGRIGGGAGWAFCR